ncbi:helix-turn-helix domain-containing protein [Streptomyces globisporus]
MTTQPERDLRAQVKAALTTARISQAEAARQLDLSTKHMSQMLTGRATLTLDWADRILTLCGMTLAIAAFPDTGRGLSTQPRIALDDLTSDALDALYDRLDRAAGLADRLEEFAENALRVDDRELYRAIATDLRTRLAP